MEIALNKESKRKTPTAVAFRNGERTFGEDALTVGVRFPSNCYIYFLDLLGKKIDNPIVDLYKKRFPYYNIIPDPKRNTVLFKHGESYVYIIELSNYISCIILLAIIFIEMIIFHLKNLWR